VRLVSKPVADPGPFQAGNESLESSVSVHQGRQETGRRVDPEWMHWQGEAGAAAALSYLRML
jgi:hypothetical protein